MTPERAAQVTVEELVGRLDLARHPEGGFFRETYRSAGSCGTPRGERSLATSIYYCLPAGEFSAFHRIRSDELWCFHDGQSIRLHMLGPDGSYRQHLLGPVGTGAQEPQVRVPAGNWFAAEVVASTGWALVGCLVAPGFDFRDFELADRDVLAREFPACRDVIVRLTRSARRVGQT